jgi:1-acyl-sn-glycerol-3-phosphate acyltransferase
MSQLNLSDSASAWSDAPFIATSGHRMQRSVETVPGPSVGPQVSAEALMKVVSALYEELHHSRPEPDTLSLQSHLERDLGFDSLARVQLILRLERSFAVELPDETLSTAETLTELLSALTSAATRTSTKPTIPAATVVQPIESTRPPLGIPTSAVTLNEVLEWHVQQHPDATHAIVLADEQSHSLTYRALMTGAKDVAGGLQHAGVQPGATVALMLPTSVEYLHAFFGVLLAGAIPVPIYPPTRPSQLEEHVQRHAGILNNAGIGALITFREARPVAHLLKMRVPSLRHVWSVVDLMQGKGFQPLQHPPSADSIAMLQYTSGSTGSPKGVILTHGNLLANIRPIGKHIGASASDVFVSWLPLYHDMGLIGAWLGSLYFGCLLVIMPPTAFLMRPVRWLRAIHQYRGTLSAAPNFGYELCARRLQDEDLRGLDLSSLRVTFNGAEPVDPDSLERFRQRFAPFGFRAEAMTPVYGLAEVAVGLTFPPLGRGPLVDCVDRAILTSTGRAVPARKDEPRALRFVSCGRPLPGYHIRIVDAGDFEVADRIEGTVQVTGPSATAGYYHNAGATSHLLHGEWRDTGDRGYRADGELYVTGRVKDIIIRRGRHIYPEEIENVVGELDGVRKGCVVAFGTKEPATATEKLVVLAETRLTDSTLRAQLRARINERVVDCLGEPAEEVVLASPHTVLKTSSGKLRRVATRAAYEDGSLGRAPATPALQLLRLTLASVSPILRRWRQAAIRVTYGAYAWGAFLVLGVPVVCLTVLAGNRTRAWHLAHVGAKWLIRAWRVPFSVTWETTVDLTLPHVIVVNHSSYVDSIFVAALLAHPHAFVAKQELKRAPVLGGYLRRLGVVFIERFAPVQSLAEVGRVQGELARGIPVIIYPEGTFTQVAGLRPFHLGAFQVARASGVPIIPVTLCGTRALLPDGRWLPRRMPVHAIVSAPLPAQVGGDDFSAAVRLRDAARECLLHNGAEPELV